MYNKVELCGVNTSQLPVLTEEEKRVLLTRARAGDGRTWTICFRWGALG